MTERQKFLFLPLITGDLELYFIYHIGFHIHLLTIPIYCDVFPENNFMKGFFS